MVVAETGKDADARFLQNLSVLQRTKDYGRKLLEVGHYCEGVVFDAQGRGYLSHGEVIEQFTADGKSQVWAETGSPNGHKILADGTHLVCDASRHAMLPK